MADRSTAAVGVANDGGATLDGAADATSGSEATGDAELDPNGDTDTAETAGTDVGTEPDSESGEAGADGGAAPPPERTVLAEPPALHSGHKLARRYRLEECVTRSDGFSSWRAVDEMLRRAVGVHVLPSDHPRAKKVLAAARSAALLGDPRFVQVLDAVEENDLVYVVHEWLPDATEMTALLAGGPLQPYDADQMVRQLSEAMAIAHREGLSHLKLDPHTVLRTESGQYRIRGLAVAAALHGVESEHPQREDTEAIGALLYAALTERWPYPEDAHGLTGLPADVGLVAPDQVRAGVHRGLSDLAMRALVNDGSTASRQEPACATPEELSKAAAAMPRVAPPEQDLPTYQRTSYQQGTYRQPPTRTPVAPPASAPLASTPPPALPGRTGKVLKWAVSALLIVGLGLGSWQIADALLHKDKPKEKDSSSGAPSSKDEEGKKPAPLAISGAREFDPEGKGQSPADVGKTYDSDKSSFWRTKYYLDGPDLKIKSGVGIFYDLGSAKEVDAATLSLKYGGAYTNVELYAADSMSGPLSAMSKLGAERTTGTTVKVTADKPSKTRYVLVWLTAMPHAPRDGYSSAGYKQAITDLSFTGVKQ